MAQSGQQFTTTNRPDMGQIPARDRQILIAIASAPKGMADHTDSGYAHSRQEERGTGVISGLFRFRRVK